MKKLKLAQAFTLIELMTVMVIIMIIAGMVVRVGSAARRKALEGGATSMIAGLGVAISMYHADMGSYPADGNTALVSALRTDPGSANWHGPYIEFKEKDLDSGQVMDPWGIAYRYDATPPDLAWGNTKSFNLWSHGPNKEDDSYDGGAPDADYGDDIYNW